MAKQYVQQGGMADENEEKFQPTHIVRKKGRGLGKNTHLHLEERSGDIYLFKKSNGDDVYLTQGQYDSLQVSVY